MDLYPGNRIMSKSELISLLSGITFSVITLGWVLGLFIFSLYYKKTLKKKLEKEKDHGNTNGST